MRYFIFRNCTVENLFGDRDVSYSGYDDISYIPEDADVYVWFYSLPFKHDREALAEEVRAHFSNLNLVYGQLQANKTFIVFTLYDCYPVKFKGSDFDMERAIADYNNRIVDLAAHHRNVKILDFADFTRAYTTEQLIDWKYYFISKMQVNPRLAKPFRAWFDHQMAEVQLKRKKCLVLDLDNTLWGGVLGEDGIEGIKIGGDYPGNAFLMFQQYLVELGKSGVILAVCSKNNEQDVLEVWRENPYIVLKEEHITVYRINWNNKADNIREIAEVLNIGLDSFVFLDDNPTERELIKQMLPMVEVPDFPEQPYMLPLFTKKLIENYFRVYELTDEDRAKTSQYKANAARETAQHLFTDFTDYLSSLEIEITIYQATAYNLSRIAQMTQKTNQFNLTTRRYSDSDIQSFIDRGHRVYCFGVKDKFGDNGITGMIIIVTGR